MTTTPITEHEVSALKVKVKQPLYRPEQALKVPGG
jgi:hypothetical protein